MKFIKITQNVKKLALAFFVVLFLLPSCKTPPSDSSGTPFSAGREGENAAVETAAEKEVPVPESLSPAETLLPAEPIVSADEKVSSAETEKPPETALSVPPAGAETANKAGEPQMLERIIRAEPQVENLNAESGSDRLSVSESAPVPKVGPAEGPESENKGKKSAKSAEKIEPAVKIVRASNTPAQASTPVPAQTPAREKGATSAGTANTKAPPTIISRTDAAPAQTSAGAVSKPAAAQSSAQVPTNTAGSRPQATNSGVERIQPAAEQTAPRHDSTPAARSAGTAARVKPAQANTPAPAQAASAGTANTKAQPTIISRTDAAPAQTSAGTANTAAAERIQPAAEQTAARQNSTPAVRSGGTAARVKPVQTSASTARTQSAPAQTPARQTDTPERPTAAQNAGVRTGSASTQASNTVAGSQPAAKNTGTKRAESADLSAESGFGLSSEPEVELASEDGSGSSSEAAAPAIVPRRSVNAKMNQFIDIPYSGRKWIFLGETEATSPPVVRFVNRTFSGDDTLFSVRAKNPGKTVLHFYRQDALENTYIDDYVAVEVLDEKAAGTNEHVRAAEIAFGKSASAEDAADSGAGNGLSSDAGKIAGNLPSALQTAVAKVSAAGQAQSAQNVQSSNGISEKDSAEAEQIYTAAQKAFEEKRYQDSLTSLTEYEASAGEDSDKALILRARVYESDSDKRNIKAALEAYEKIVNFFPESVFWDEAKRRSTYLRRFYFDIR